MELDQKRVGPAEALPEEIKNSEMEGASREVLDINRFVAKVYQLFAGSLVGGAVGAYVGTQLALAGNFNSLLFWGGVILEFVLLFAVIGFRKRAPLNLFLLYGFTFMTGFVLGPLLGHLIGVGKGGIIGEAFLLTAVGFFGLTWFSMVTKRDFTGLGKFLIVALLILIAASILNLFLQAPMLQLAIAAGGAILFSIFVIYDTQQIIRGNVETPIEGAIMLYLDFLNLFLSLLQLLDND